MSTFSKSLVAVTVGLASALVINTAFAQVPQYGTTINLEQARKAVAAGMVEARKNNWPVAIAVVPYCGT